MPQPRPRLHLLQQGWLGDQIKGYQGYLVAEGVACSYWMSYCLPS